MNSYKPRKRLSIEEIEHLLGRSVREDLELSLLRKQHESAVATKEEDVVLIQDFLETGEVNPKVVRALGRLYYKRIVESHAMRATVV